MTSDNLIVSGLGMLVIGTSIGIAKTRLKIIKDGIVTTAKVKDYQINIDGSYRIVYEYMDGLINMEAPCMDISRGAHWKSGKIGSKAYIIYDKKNPNKVRRASSVILMIAICIIAMAFGVVMVMLGIFIDE